MGLYLVFIFLAENKRAKIKYKKLNEEWESFAFSYYYFVRCIIELYLSEKKFSSAAKLAIRKSV